MKTLAALADNFFDGVDLSKYSGATKAESDRQCFRKVLSRFLARGDKSDAFCVYFCFSEIFALFGEGYGNTQKLLELLSDHEYHSGELLSKHRDHYSHSVYVFALGLAIYAHDATYRNNFLNFYALSDNRDSQLKFLYLWGMTALFHDIGYPFQLAHEQIKIYACEVWGESADFSPYVSFGNYDSLIKLSTSDSRRISNSLKADRHFKTLNQMFAFGLNLRLGYDESDMCRRLKTRIVRQPAFMDHGYFSSVILARQLLAQKSLEMTIERLDVLTAIILHNSLSQHEFKNQYPVSPEAHPVAYLLMLCDELQNWDRQAYGKESKHDPIAWEIELDIENNFISAIYLFDSIVTYDRKTGLSRINKHYDDAQTGKFVRKILGDDTQNGILKSSLKLDVTPRESPKQRKPVFTSQRTILSTCATLPRPYTQATMNSAWTTVPTPSPKNSKICRLNSKFQISSRQNLMHKSSNSSTVFTAARIWTIP